ncbi:hypothetical protein PoB_002246800 [Plakobranchus ocellatus]|uniref:Uncharacterized protein n=1 Tax=Plakobranchus ocellatus TaxID=259542 RepID=A0AAV3ZNB1_9GAST|nr:hypothetical protein PoB_002246800 [Plakobranchus ocellatus]
MQAKSAASLRETSNRKRETVSIMTQDTISSLAANRAEIWPAFNTSTAKDKRRSGVEVVFRLSRMPHIKEWQKKKKRKRISEEFDILNSGNSLSEIPYATSSGDLEGGNSAHLSDELLEELVKWSAHAHNL